MGLRPPAPARALWLALVAALSRSADGLTLDLLRSHLSHEVSAKFARLAGLIFEWKAGRARPDDASEAQQVLLDLESLYTRHARLAARSRESFHRVVRILLAVVRMKAWIRAGTITRPVEIDRFERELAVMERSARVLVDGISRRVAVRLADVAREAVDEVERESQIHPKASRVVLSDGIQSGDGGGIWIPRAEAGRWHDLIKNLLRNGVDATLERQEEQGGRTGPGAAGPGRVSVTLRQGTSSGRAVLEIADEGIGIDPEEVGAIWTAGRSRHGRGRGHGLTEAKRDFLASRATLEVRSAPGLGTCVRAEIAARDVPIGRTRLWEAPPALVPILLVLLGMTVGLLAIAAPEPSVVRVIPPTIVVAQSAGGRTLWQRNLNETIVPNEPTIRVIAGGAEGVDEPPVMIRGAAGRLRSIVVASQPQEGAGRIWFLDRRGHPSHVRRLHWIPPTTSSINKLTAPWIKEVAWGNPEPTALVVHVRDGNECPTVTQFTTVDGEPLGAYYHWGHLHYRADLDVDGDGKIEILLQGINNHAQSDASMFREDAGVYISCVVLLEVPRVSGQAYPYSKWQGVPRAEEEGYLLIPPIAEGVTPMIYQINIGEARADGVHPVEVVLEDGRIYRCDKHLRPLSCRTGDGTRARALEPIRPVGPLVYICGGTRDNIDMAVPSGEM